MPSSPGSPLATLLALPGPVAALQQVPELGMPPQVLTAAGFSSLFLKKLAATGNSVHEGVARRELFVVGTRVVPRLSTCSSRWCTVARWRKWWTTRATSFAGVSRPPCPTPPPKCCALEPPRRSSPFLLPTTSRRPGERPPRDTPRAVPQVGPPFRALRLLAITCAGVGVRLARNRLKPWVACLSPGQSAE